MEYICFDCVFRYHLLPPIDVIPSWELFKDGMSCSSGKTLLSKNITYGGECMALANVTWPYVSFMSSTDVKGHRYCYGYGSCPELYETPNYKTYAREGAPGRGESYSIVI